VSLRDFTWGLDRYVLHSLLVQNHQWWCAAGFQMDADIVVGAIRAWSFGWRLLRTRNAARKFSPLRRWAGREGWKGYQIEFDEGHGQGSTDIVECKSFSLERITCRPSERSSSRR
jgi:hypothetical protein